MAAGMALSLDSRQMIACPAEPTRNQVGLALVVAILFVVTTRWPVARVEPFEFDESSFVYLSTVHWFPMHHTLFMTFGRLFGLIVGDPYRGFILLDVLMSAAALVSAWWMLRAIVMPATAAAAALVLGTAPVFWGYGAIAGNYTAIIAVGSLLLGIAYRGLSSPKAWQPLAASIVLAIGTGYREDIGVFWLPVFGVILWQHRWKPAIEAGLLFTALNLAWLAAMLLEVGGWTRYRAASAEFAHEAGYLNSFWNLGFTDGPLRYAVKLTMALVWTLGPALFFVPRGAARLGRLSGGWIFGSIMALAALPALGSHLLIHFGVAGYCFHYVPALVALMALGAGRSAGTDGFAGTAVPRSPARAFDGAEVPRLITTAIALAGMFLLYPTDYSQQGWRGNFDLSFCRFTRIGLKTPLPDHAPEYWRTANSRPLAGTPVRRPAGSRAGAG
jgi:Dolichyl-phosphate-mannose-protein mannosyltransferase